MAMAAPIFVFLGRGLLSDRHQLGLVLALRGDRLQLRAVVRLGLGPLDLRLLDRLDAGGVLAPALLVDPPGLLGVAILALLCVA